MWCVAGLLWVLLGPGAAESGRAGDQSSAAGDLVQQAASYLRRLARDEAVVAALQTASRVAAVAGDALAAGLNVCSRYLAELLAAGGLDVAAPSQVSAEGVVFVGQWLLLSLIGYWLVSLLLRSLACSLRLAVWLLKVGGAMAAFILILSDHAAAAAETTAIRLAVLVLLCVLLGVGPRRGGATDDKTPQLEKHVKTLEKRVREMERLIDG